MQDITDILESLKRSPKILSHFVHSIPEPRLDIRRGAGFWTIAEHFSHLAQVQPMLVKRIERFLSEEQPEFVPYLPGDGETEPATPLRMSVASALEQFTRDRASQLLLLERATPGDWQKIAIHPEYEQYSLPILTRHILMHDHWHMYRMEELWLTRDAYLTRLE